MLPKCPILRDQRNNPLLQSLSVRLTLVLYHGLLRNLTHSSCWILLAYCRCGSPYNCLNLILKHLQELLLLSVRGIWLRIISEALASQVCVAEFKGFPQSIYLIR